MEKNVKQIIEYLLEDVDKTKYEYIEAGKNQDAYNRGRAHALIYASGFFGEMKKHYGDQTLTLNELADILDRLSYIDYDRIGR